MKKLLIIGAGGFGREVVGIVAAINALTPTWELVGVLDDSPTVANNAALLAMGSQTIGPVCDLPSFDAEAVLAIGSPVVRARVDADHPNARWAILTHPGATIGPDVSLGVGTVIAPGARLSTNIRGGRHLQFDQNTTVGHDAVFGDYVRLNPQACVSGGVAIGDRTLIGASAVILEGRTVGSDVVVGAGAVVTHDVPPGATVKGVPAR